MARHHNRRSIRLKGYDYTQPGAYFITICTRERAHLFGHVVDGLLELSPYGAIVREEWFKTAIVRPYVRLYDDEFVVMPNHVHGIIWIVGDAVGTTDVVTLGRGAAALRPCNHDDHGMTSDAATNVAPRSLGAIIRGFKSAVTKRINIARQSPGGVVWQRNYYERIIRNDRALHAIRRYIAQNPRRWHWDRYNPDRMELDYPDHAQMRPQNRVRHPVR